MSIELTAIIITHDLQEKDYYLNSNYYPENIK